jgi:hypothetical protein
VIAGAEKSSVVDFEFEKTFPPAATQPEVFAEVSGLVTSVCDGYSTGRASSAGRRTQPSPASSAQVQRVHLRVRPDRHGQDVHDGEWHRLVSAAGVADGTRQSGPPENPGVNTRALNALFDIGSGAGAGGRSGQTPNRAHSQGARRCYRHDHYGECLVRTHAL